VSRDFLLQFFYESSSPKPLKITLGSFRIFFENFWRFTSGKFATGSMTPAVN
jgi:hypothetical protein